MATMLMSSMCEFNIVYAILLLSLVCVPVLVLYKHITIRQRRASLALTHACKPIISEYKGHRLLFGLDLIWESRQHIQRHDFAAAVAARFATHGSTHHSHVLGVPIISTNEPANIRAFATTAFDDFSILPARVTLVTYVFGGIFGHDGAEWSLSRGLLRPLSRMHYAAASTYDQHATKLIDIVRTQRGAPFDLRPLALRFTMDTVTQLTLGVSTESLVDDIGQGVGPRFARDFTRLEQIAQALTLYGQRIKLVAPFLYGRELFSVSRRAHNYVHSIVEGAMRRRRKADMVADSPAQPSTFVLVDELVKACNSADRVRQELMSVLLAGHDSSATLLSELFWLLARNQTAWTALQAEVATLAGGDLTLDMLKRMHYLRAAIDESKSNTHEAQTVD